MQIRFTQLRDKLSKSLISPLLVSGDEPYQHMQACDMYRARAKELGFSERKVLTSEKNFDWAELEQEKNNMSLFGERILIDLRIPNGKPGASGSKAIINFLHDMHEDVMLLIQAPRLDRNVINSAWVKALDKVGVMLRIWPLNEMETRKWIQEKLRAKKLNASNDIIEFITQQVEGNLLAAMQEIEKISLISQNNNLDSNAIRSIISNSSHYSLNELMNVVIKGDVAKIIRIIDSLKKEDVAPPLLLWGLTEQIRKLIETKPDQAVISTDHKNALQNMCFLNQENIDTNSKLKMSDLLKKCAHVDRVIKGRSYGDSWQELLKLSIATRLSV